MRILAIVIGVVLVIAGVSCVFTPVVTYSMLPWFVGIAMLVDAVGNLCAYRYRRSLGLGDGWSLAGAIVSLLFALLLMGSSVLQATVGVLFALVAAIWMIAMGLVRIFWAIQMLKVRAALPVEQRGHKFLYPMIVGLVMLALGVFGCFNPAATLIAVGIMMGMIILASGIGLLINAMI